MTMRLIRVLCAVLLALGAARVGATSEGAVSLERGYQLMYGLDFASAEQVFVGWRSAHPRDPLAPMSQAANVLFSELYRSYCSIATRAAGRTSPMVGLSPRLL
jgi:hypothetical protein